MLTIAYKAVNRLLTIFAKVLGDGAKGLKIVGFVWLLEYLRLKIGNKLNYANLKAAARLALSLHKGGGDKRG